jgi:hypothetical protein
MHTLVIVAGVMAFVLLVVLVELAAALLPLVFVVLCVPPEQRPELARLLAVVDSSPKLRLWRALRLAALARRRERAASR